MQNKQQVFLYIKDEIERISSKEEQRILQEAKAIEEEALKNMQNEAHQDAMHQLDKELAAITSKASIEAASQLEIRTKALVDKRNGYVDAIFDAVKEKLVSMTQSDMYQDYLVAHIQKAREYAMEHCTLYLREEDMHFASILQDAYGYSLDVEASQTIQLGGFILENKENHIMIDETLESNLESQKDWFFKTSGLMIK